MFTRGFRDSGGACGDGFGGGGGGGGGGDGIGGGDGFGGDSIGGGGGDVKKNREQIRGKAIKCTGDR